MVIVIENGISDGFIYILKKKKVYITQYILTQALCQKKKKKRQKYVYLKTTHAKFLAYLGVLEC